MKIKNITLKNFMKYDQITCSFDESVTYLIGKNGQGKSELGLYGVQAVLQGIAEKVGSAANPLFGERFRFIGPKGATAMTGITLIDELKGNAEIRVTRKITKSGSELSIVAPDDYEGVLDQAWLNTLFNLFMIAPKQFQMLSSKEQANALGIDTAPFDKEIAALKIEHTAINREIAAFGPLEPLDEILEVNIVELQAKKEKIRQDMAVVYRANQATNKATREAWQAEKDGITFDVDQHNKTMKARTEHLELVSKCYDDLVCYGYDGSDVPEWIEEIKKDIQKPKSAAVLWPKEPTTLADMPEDYQPAEGERVFVREMPDQKDLEAIDKEIAEAGETNKKALLYTQYLQKKADREVKEKLLAENKAKQQSRADDRTDYIKKFKFPFSNLTVGDDGELLMNGRPLKEPHFSTGEMLKIIPILISTSNPDLKYVFLQDFNLMDEDKQAEVEKYLTDKGFQLVIEFVGKKKLTDKNCILLKDNVIVEDYETISQPALSL